MSKPALLEAVLMALGELPQGARIAPGQAASFAQRLAAEPRSVYERSLRELRGLTTPELAVLLHEARGERDARSCARTIARSKLLQRASALAGAEPLLDVALPLAASLLTQGHGSFALDLSHSAAAARLDDNATHRWLLPDPAIQFVRLPSSGGMPRFGLAYVRCVETRSDAVVDLDARLALSLAAHAAVTDGVLLVRPEALFVLNVVAPGLDAWAPLLRRSPAAAAAVRAALIESVWHQAPPVRLHLEACSFDPAAVRDALRVGEGFWARCVVGGAVPALPPEGERRGALDGESAARAHALTEQFLSMERVVEGLASRMEAQRAALVDLAGAAKLAAGAHGSGAGRIEVMDRLDVGAASEELAARGIPATEWSVVAWDVDGMRAALESLGVDVSGFARAGTPDPVRMQELLGQDARAFLRADLSIAWTQSDVAEPQKAALMAVADEVASNVSDVLAEQIACRMDAAAAGTGSSAQGVRAA